MTPKGDLQVSRRSLLKAAALTGLTLGPLSACGNEGGAGSTSIRFHQSKPEVIGYFDELLKTFSSSHPKVNVTHDATTSLVAGFVREQPPDLALENFLLDVGNFVTRGTLSDLSDLPEAKTIDPDIQAQVRQYASYREETSVLPYSVTAAGVIYNKALFEKHDQQVPATWDELVGVCKAFTQAGVTPLYGTYTEPWTISQGLFDYVSGSMLDIADFYDRLKKQGGDVGPGSRVSFSKDFAPAVDRMLELTSYCNKNAASRDYGDGNVAFAKGDAAMYLQGPWAIGEISKLNPKLQLGTFPLCATDDPADAKARINFDLAMWIPKGSSTRSAATQLVTYLMQPNVINKYNKDNLGFSPLRNAPKATDPRIAGLQKPLDQGRIYQGAGTYVPPVIPLPNYLQELVITKNADLFLKRMDRDWARLAKRTLV
jgi:raffinose/stachyose/melibiose transport system substrate-binding protein